MSEQATNGTVRFSLKRTEWPFELEDEAGQIKQYLLREMDGRQRDGYMNLFRSKMEVVGQGESARMFPKDFTGQYADFLALSVYDAANNQLVPLPVIQKWPATVQEALFRKSQELSGFGAEQTAESKNASRVSG